MQVNMHEAKSSLSKLGEKVWKGEPVVIAKAGKPYLDLVPHRGRTEPRIPGRFKGQITIAEGPLGGVVDVSYFDTQNDRPNSDFQNLNVRSNIAVELAEGVYFDLLGYYQDSQLGAAGSSLSLGFPERQRNDNEAWLLSPRLTIERDAWDFSLFYSHNDSELNATRLDPLGMRQFEVPTKPENPLLRRCKTINYLITVIDADGFHSSTRREICSA